MRIMRKFRGTHKVFLDQIFTKGQNVDGSVHVVKSKHAFEICIDNATKHNCINGKMMNELADICDYISSDEEPPVGLIMYSKGEYFCAGADFQIVNSHVDTPEKGQLMLNFMTDVLNYISTINCISVSVINGPAIGGGAELTTATDFRIINQNAYIQFIQARLGVTPGWGGFQRLLNSIGRKHTLQLLGTSMKITPTLAYEMDLVDEIYDSSVLHMTDLERGYHYLQPYIDQPYPDVIQRIKGLTTIYKNSICDDKQQTVVEFSRYEKDAFFETWASDNNKKAINNLLNSMKINK